mmetsp:Transcript_25856/g.64583  ORF Transcript_25856/g.64583 Transcript_25856/m.64583 type:complete len:204 (+) Transcript_25856:2507-3118(+)
MAFMKVLRDRRSMLKKGSRMGYFSLPHSAVCSRMCATPRESTGVVRNATLKTLLGSSAPQCNHLAPVLVCSSSAHATEYSETTSTDSTSKAPFASFWPGTRAAMAATAGTIARPAPAAGGAAASTALADAEWAPPRWAKATPATPWRRGTVRAARRGEGLVRDASDRNIEAAAGRPEESAVLKAAMNFIRWRDGARDDVQLDW